MNLPRKLGAGQNIFDDGVKCINGIIDYLKSSFITGDKTIRVTQGNDSFIISSIAKNSNAGGSGSAADEYTGYFKVIVVNDGEEGSTDELWVVDGADYDADNCGYFTAGNSNVYVESLGFTGVTTSGTVYLRIYWDDEEEVYVGELNNAASLPSVANEVNVELATYIYADSSLTITQRWIDGAITTINGSYVA